MNCLNLNEGNKLYINNIHKITQIHDSNLL